MMHQDDFQFGHSQASLVNVQHIDNLYLNQDHLSSDLNDFSLKGCHRSSFKSKKRSLKKKLRKIKKKATALYEKLENEDLLDDGSYEMDMYDSFFF